MPWTGGGSAGESGTQEKEGATEGEGLRDEMKE